MDVLPFAKAFVNENWLKNDWYLNINVPYRNAFNYIIGHCIEFIGLWETLIIWRFISYLLLSYAIWRFLKKLTNTNNTFILCTVIAFDFIFFHSGLGAGESITGGVETKVFSYVAVILSIPSIMEKNYRKGFAFAGVALSLHILVGFYNLLCLFPILLLNHNKFKNVLNEILRASPYFLILGAIGIYGIVVQLFLSEGASDTSGWDIYVNFRLPHHILPDRLPKLIWILFSLFLTSNVFIFLKTKNEKFKKLTAFTLTACGISFIGIIIYFTPIPNHNLRYYFFRFADSMLPFVTLAILSTFLAKKTKGFKSIVLIGGLGLIIILLLIPRLRHIKYQGTTSIKTFSEIYNFDIEMSNWIKQNTNKDLIFITHPTSSYFYVNCERAMFVSWKHLPQNSALINEWYNRLKYLNGGKEIKDLAEVESNFKNLTKEDVLKIKKDYNNIGYLLTSSNSKIDLPLLYKSDKKALYSLEKLD